MATEWTDYLAAAGAPDSYRQCHEKCQPSFAPLREVIRGMIEANAPDTIACLGAGVLNDIPYQAIVRDGATLHLVDWLPGVIETGIRCSVITDDEAGMLSCLYCSLGDDTAAAYCRNYRSPESTPANVCGRFAPDKGNPPCCEAFEIGELPHVWCEDVTAGLATEFGRRVPGVLRGVESWRQALRRATALVKQVNRHHESLSVPDDSVDLVVSSMVLSQFEHEPYKYFSRQAAEVLGAPHGKEEERLEPALQTLRNDLLEGQIEHHCTEIERMLAPGGRCLMAFELFTLDPEVGRWVLVREMHEALDSLARRFRFDFDRLDAREMVLPYRNRGASSLVMCLVLEAGKA